MRRAMFVLWSVGLMAMASGCGDGDGSGPDGGNDGPSLETSTDDSSPHDGGGDAPADGAPHPTGVACSDLFEQGTLPTYSLEVSGGEWARIEQEFLDVSSASLNAHIYHPAVFRYGSEVVSDAAIRLKGQSSRRFASVMGGLNGKMQFVVSFEQVVPDKKFHGVGKLIFDMPPSDASFLHERLSNNWFRRRGITAPCTNSGRLEINGAFYGLFAVEEAIGPRVLKQFFPDYPDGDLLKGGYIPETNEGMINKARLNTFWGAFDFPAMEAVVDVANSLREWAIESLINDADGYYGGAHNFYIYDQGPKGWVWLPHDVDATFDWSGSFDDHPLFWWVGRSFAEPPGQHYLVMLNDPVGRGRYVDALASELAAWDETTLQSWIDAWSAQIADSVAADPHKATTIGAFWDAVALAKEGVVERARLIQSYVDCARGGAGTDADHDGTPWCDDCRDDAASVHPGASESCGNQADDNCNGFVDDGC